MEFELHTLDQRLGKFEGVQQQHDQRLAEIEQRLGTIEMLIRDVRVEGHREREALRDELVGQISGVRAQITGTRMALTHRIDAVRTEPIRRINNDHTGPMRALSELSAELEITRVELNGRLDRLNDKIDGLYRWVIATFVAAGVNAIMSILDGFF